MSNIKITPVTPAQAKNALIILESFNKDVVRPFYEQKIANLPDKHRYGRTAGLFTTRRCTFAQALNSIRYEVERLNE